MTICQSPEPYGRSEETAFSSGQTTTGNYPCLTPPAAMSRPPLPGPPLSIEPHQAGQIFYACQQVCLEPVHGAGSKLRPASTSSTSLSAGRSDRSPAVWHDSDLRTQPTGCRRAAGADPPLGIASRAGIRQVILNSAVKPMWPTEFSVLPGFAYPGA